MSSYRGRHAEWYDIIYADKPYEQEARFVDECVRTYGARESKRLLELACGTGTHALLLEKLGYQIVAIDASPEMIVRARKKAADAGSRVDFREQDMRALELNGQDFDAAICLFDSLGYALTNAAIARVLQDIHRHLRQDGLFIFEYWHAAAMLRGYNPLRVRHWPLDGGELLRVSQTSLSYDEQIAAVTYNIYELRGNGTYERLEETHKNRYFSIPEMAGLLETKGFVPLKWFAGFSHDERISDQTWHVVAVARKRS